MGLRVQNAKDRANMPTEGPGEAPPESGPAEVGTQVGVPDAACHKALARHHASPTEREGHEQAGSGETA